MRPGPFWIILLLSAALAAPLYAIGWFAPAEFPDSQGYMRAATAPEPWGMERHPLYGWLVLAMDSIAPGRALVPAVQYAVHALAAASLAAACRCAGMSSRAAMALGASALLSQGLAIWGRAVLPEMLSVSLLMLAFAAAVAAARGRWFLALALGCVLSLGAAYTLRPIMLPAILAVPLLYALSTRILRSEWRLGRAALLLAAALLPLVAQSAYRWQKLGDFGLVSFGGFGISGLTVQLLTPDALDRLPEAHRPLARLMLERKDEAVAEQAAMPLFRNSIGQRSFQTTAIDGFDTLARNFDEIMWGKLTGLRGADESWVAFNARMGAVNGAILRALPERWLYWTIGATSRLVGRLLTYNAAFVAVLLLFAVVALVNILRSGAALGGATGRSWTMLSLIVLAWVASTTGLSVVAAFPALRYIDTGGMLLTALPLYGLFLALRNTSDDAPA